MTHQRTRARRGVRAREHESSWATACTARRCEQGEHEQGGVVGVVVIQQVLFEVAAPYYGHPYFVTGHALFNAIARRADAAVRRELAVSHGVFVPKEFGEYPRGHSQSGYAGKLGGELPAVEAYEDLFVYRDPRQGWLQDGRPRDAHNTHDLQSHGGRLAFAPECFFGRPPETRNRKRSVSWYVHCYLHTGRGESDVLPVGESVLDGVRVGGARNYGFGELEVVDTQLVDLEELDYSRLEAGAASDEGRCQLELVSPYVLRSEFSGADEQSVPWWWKVDNDRVSGASAGGVLRRRETQLAVDGATHAVEVLDHGQIVGFDGGDVVGTAKNGVLRVGTHSKYGFGELRVRPPGGGRVPERGPAGERVNWRERRVDASGGEGL